MTDAQPHNSMILREDQPLIAIPIEWNGQKVVRYFAGDAAADSAAADEAPKRALAAIGSWSDLDWEEMEAALDRIRHASPPTPPIDLDL